MRVRVLAHWQSSKYLNDKKKKLQAFKNTTNAKYVPNLIERRVY